MEFVAKSLIHTRDGAGEANTTTGQGFFHSFDIIITVVFFKDYP